MLSNLQHHAWHFAVILSFAFKPVPYFLPTPFQRIQSALLQFMCNMKTQKEPLPLKPHGWSRWDLQHAHPHEKITPFLHRVFICSKWSCPGLSLQDRSKAEPEPELPCCRLWSFSLGRGVLSLTSDLNLKTAWMLSCYLFTGVSFSFPCCNLAGQDT